MGRSWVIFVCLLFSACATTPPPRSTRVYIYQNPVATFDRNWVRVEEAHWFECDMTADRKATAALEEKLHSADAGLYDPDPFRVFSAVLLGLTIASQNKALEQERDVDYAQTMKKCLQAKGYLVRPAIAPPTTSFSDTPEQVAAKRAAQHKWVPEQYKLLVEEAAQRAKQ